MPLPLFQHPSNGLPLLTTGLASPVRLRGYVYVHLRYGLHLCRKVLTTLDYSNAAPSFYQGI